LAQIRGFNRSEVETWTGGNSIANLLSHFNDENEEEFTLVIGSDGLASMQRDGDSFINSSHKPVVNTEVNTVCSMSWFIFGFTQTYISAIAVTITVIPIAEI
jgi:nicotinic acid mononucleotide adenylyltransferase